LWKRSDDQDDAPSNRGPRGLACGAGLAAGAYAAYVGTTWLGYGRVRPGVGDDQDLLLDRFIPAYEIVERHRITVAAPAGITFAAACDLDLLQSAAIRAIFRGRELMMGSQPDPSDHPRGILALTKSLGWGVLAEVPGREVVVGAVTQPWNANVVFRSLPPDAFAAFTEPDYVKIVDAARRFDRSGRFYCPHGDTGHDNRCWRAQQVPSVLVAGLARHRRDSARGVEAREGGGRAPCRSVESDPQGPIRSGVRRRSRSAMLTKPQIERWVGFCR
jgi:hypothetical protein